MEAGLWGKVYLPELCPGPDTGLSPSHLGVHLEAEVRGIGDLGQRGLYKEFQGSQDNREKLYFGKKGSSFV